MRSDRESISAAYDALDAAFETVAALSYDTLDIAVALVLSLTLGFSPRLALAFALELVPGADLFPTWTAVVASIATVGFGGLAALTYSGTSDATNAADTTSQNVAGSSTDATSRARPRHRGAKRSWDAVPVEARQSRPGIVYRG